MKTTLLFFTLFIASLCSSSQTETITNKDVIELTLVGLPQDIIISKIGESNCNFDLSLDGLKSLVDYAVPAEVIREMFRVTYFTSPATLEKKEDVKILDSKITADTTGIMSNARTKREYRNSLMIGSGNSFGILGIGFSLTSQPRLGRSSRLELIATLGMKNLTMTNATSEEVVDPYDYVSSDFKYSDILNSRVKSGSDWYTKFVGAIGLQYYFSKHFYLDLSYGVRDWIVVVPAYQTGTELTGGQFNKIIDFFVADVEVQPVKGGYLGLGLDIPLGSSCDLSFSFGGGSAEFKGSPFKGPAIYFGGKEDSQTIEWTGFPLDETGRRQRGYLTGQVALNFKL